MEVGVPAMLMIGKDMGPDLESKLRHIMQSGVFLCSDRGVGGCV